jgi:DNA repair protein RadC
VLEASGGLRALCSEDLAQLSTLEALGRRRAAILLAALELTRRAQTAPERRPRLLGPRGIYEHLLPALSHLPREVFHVLSFNPRGLLLRDKRVAIGTVDTCPVDPREIFAEALAARATSVVLAHNHPSGDPQPSTQDLSLTRQLAEGGRLLGIQVADHLILGQGSYFSFLEHRLLPSRQGPTCLPVEAEGG